jgi:two-component system, sensor histidine kinase RegB
MMTAQTPQFLLETQRSNWVRLRTLVILRWFAVVGQSIAIVFAYSYFELQIPIGLCATAVGVAVLGNLIAIFVYPENKRLSDREALSMLAFDVLQLGFLLFLTGGLHNPFAVLILAPVTIAATFLHLRQTVLLGLFAILLITFVAEFHIPIETNEGFILSFPSIFLFGFWLALVIGVVFLGIYAHRVITEMHNMSDALAATQLALAREQKLTDLGGVVAAAAHELGTPLATITLVSSELMNELDKGSEKYDDAVLIRDQADRCRDILRSMGQSGKDDLLLKHAPLETVVQEAAAPHVSRGKLVNFVVKSDADDRQPTILRKPEIIHGVRNLIQNAVDFSTSEVVVESRWTEDTISIRISDDGRGFPSHVIGRLGDPFLNRRRIGLRPGYEGMGLGLFIAKTLLERSGATLTFSNGGQSRKSSALAGAIVEVIWPRNEIETPFHGETKALGENQQFEL